MDLNLDKVINLKNVKIVIEYSGKRYSGWQRQINAPTVQGEIEKALFKATGKKINVNGSSRTDAGVHALGMCANFRADISIPVERLPFALNAKLPQDISVVDAELVHFDFHARYSAKGKKYVYSIYNRNFLSPRHSDYYWHVPKKLDVQAMKEAAQHIIGKHDFGTFKSMGASNPNDVRTVHGIEFVHQGEIVEMHISGDGFLYNMVRIIMGTLVDVGVGKIRPEKMREIMLSKDRKNAGKTAPAHGLMLKEVYY